MQSNNNILIAQGGGPTNVINQSLVGIINGEKNKNSNIIGAINGVRGIVDNNFIKLSKFNDVNLKKIQNTPGAALGSTRDKPDEKYCHEILKILNKKKIKRFYYIGGNDSSDSLRIISNYVKEKNYNTQCIHIPKTIDNDLVKNDHTPGFGSAAKYVAQLFSGINYDVRSLPGVYLGIVMGRHAGFLTAASSLLRKLNSDGPHLIFLPEYSFKIKDFLEQVKKIYDKYGRCIIAVSEGIQDNKGNLISKKIIQNNEYDAHGNIQLSGSGALGDYLSNILKTKLKIKRVRADTLGYAQRSFLGAVSEVDQKEAYNIGLMATKFSIKTSSPFSVAIKERERFDTKYNTKIIMNKLEDVAGKTKVMKKEFYDTKTFNVTKKFRDYCLPIIGKDILDTLSII
ncbi:MAG: diphosphate--fructose-6-phosphate 1-phosphotransferase [Alphaproteobacteria bacterium]